MQSAMGDPGPSPVGELQESWRRKERKYLGKKKLEETGKTQFTRRSQSKKIS